MKKFLLTAGSVVALAASSQALEVQLTGEVSTQIYFDGSMFSDPMIGGMADDHVSLSMSGNGEGWNYGVSFNLLEHDLMQATVNLGHLALGQFEIAQYEVKWSREFLADALNVEVNFQPSDIESFDVTLFGELGATYYDVSINNDAGRTFTAEVGFPVMGVNVGAYFVGVLADTSDVSYGMELGSNVAGVDVVVAFDEVANINLEAQLGSFEIASSASDGDLFNDVHLGYSQDVTDNLEFAATLGMSGGMTYGDAVMYLRF